MQPPSKILGLVVLLAAAYSLSGCSRQSPTQFLKADTSQKLPFHASPRQDGLSPTDSFLPTSIPAGTEIMVHLRTIVSNPHPGDALDATLEGSLLVNNQPVASSGATATLRVMEVIESPRPQDPSYLRIVLTAVAVNGKLLPVETSSIFLKGSAQHKTSQERSAATAIVYGPGGSLAFRLLQSAQVEI